VAALSNVEIKDRLKDLPDWSHAGKVLQRKYTFPSFMPAIAFVNRIAEAAEKAGHHPDITINYNVVHLALSTHSEGGVTEKDFALAREIDRLVAHGA
jgi:4a-hydroxytetrahydrobiopterin dehydratase